MRVRVFVAALLACLAAVAVGCGASVPDVKGMTPEQATEALAGAGFKAGRVDYDPAASGAPGAVIAQDPAAGARVTAGAVVNLTVAGSEPSSQGADASAGVVVPSLAGMSRTSAESAITAAGLTVGAVGEAWDPAAPKGTVITQSPGAGATVEDGSAVGFTLSRGPEPVASSDVTLPGVEGDQYADAVDELTGLGLVVSKVTKVSSAPAGQVIGQSPSAGSTVAKGSSVVLTVSGGGPAKVNVPAVKGLALATAKAKIAAAGLKWKHVLGPGDGMTDMGFVYKQVPASGVSVLKGTVVVIYTWTGP